MSLVGVAFAEAREVPSSGDLAIRITSDSETLFIANPLEGTIYAVSVSGAVGGFQAPRESFKVFLHSSQVPHPLGLAIDETGGRLIVTNAEPAAVLQINLKTAEVGTIWEGWPLRAPSSVAVVADTIVVTDATVSGTFILRPGQKPELRADSSLPRAARLSAVGSTVIVFDPDHASMFSFQPREHSYDGNLVTPLPSNARVQLSGGYSDFAYQNGIIYATGQGAMAVFAIGDNNAYIYQNAAIGLGDRIAVDQRLVFLLDPATLHLIALPRPVPSTIRFEGTLGDTQAGILMLFQYLQRRSLPGRRTYHVPQATTSAQQLLIDSGVLPGGPLQFSRNVETDARKLLCGLNRCDAGKQTYTLETDMDVPSATVESFLLTQVFDLAGKSVSQALDERVYSPKLRDQITAKYLAELNGTRLSSLAKTAVYNLFPSTSAEPRQTGDIVKIQSGKAILVGNVSSCGVFLTPSVSPYPVPSPRVQGDEALGYLRRATGGNIASKDLKGAGAANLQVRFRDINRASIDAASYTQALRGSRANCIETLVGPDTFLVSEVVQAGAFDSIFLSDNDLPMSLSESQLSKLGLSTALYSAPYTLAITPQTPVQLGYHVLKLDDPSHFTGQTASDPSLHTGAERDIFSVNTGQLVLPYERWQVTVLVPASDIYDEKSELRNLKRSIAGMSNPRPLESLPFSAKAMPWTWMDSPIPADLAAAVQRRQQLLTDIHYNAAHMAYLPPLQRDYSYVGVVEDEHSVDKQHADFWDASGEGAWYDMADGCVLSPSAHVPEEAPLTFKKDYNDKDHGTFIGAIIAGRSGTLGPGLAPQARLVLLPSTGELPQFIQDANCHNVAIFNLSVNSDLSADDSNRGDNAAVLDSLRNQIKITDALFIVAAGDSGSNLDSAGSVAPPISWAPDLPNVIGVAASDGHHIAKTNTQGRAVSSYGRKYVQLAAPGTQVPSAGEKNSYVIAEGSSPAVPQVAAAAAVLLGEGVTKPLVIKARLMYTADSSPDLDQDLWGGGLLNFDRAIWLPGSNLFITNTSSPVWILIQRVQPTSMELSGEDDSPSGPPRRLRTKVPATKLLRITADHLGSELKRVIYLDEDNRMRVMVRATVRGVFKCAAGVEATEWNEIEHKVIPRTECSGTINMEQVNEYVAAAPLTVSF